ncbi:MAG TPA: ABC transporter permease subunit [Xanthobacteraceae bacterium]|jgi:sulfonate transport system permease protein|nr:ABC transporter permease subunit [Xanthobacteraceae bacterium]
MNKAMQRVNLPGLAVIAICAGLWELYCRTLGSGFDSIASTYATILAVKDLLLQGPLLEQLLHTTSVAIWAWLIASALGFVIGLCLGLSRTAWTYTMASIEVLRSIPSISFLSIAVLLFGFSAKTEMVIVVYVSLWPMLLGTLGGMRSTPGGLLEVARIFHLSAISTFFKIILPAALPVIVVGLRLSLTLSIALAVVAEMIGNPEGLGFGIVSAQQAMRPADAFAYLLVIGILGWGLNAIFAMATHRLDFAYGRPS